MTTLQVGAGISTDINAARAAADAADEAQMQLSGEIPNLVVCFISADHAEFAEDVSGFLGERFPGAAVIGCTTEGVVGGSREIEQGPAVSLLAAFLPDTRVVPFGLQFAEIEGEARYEGWPDMLPPDATILMLCDRFSFPAAHLLAAMNETRPGQIVVGGVASGGRAPGDTRLFYGGKVFTEGAVSVSIAGRVRVTTLVSQGCRPIGRAGTITRADRNIIFEIGGKPALEMFAEAWSKSDPETRALLQTGPQIGVVIDEYKTEYERGDFLVHPIMGSDRSTGGIAVGDIMEIGETVQFHVRDPESADDDLRALLHEAPATAGALLFTCNGRGTNLFDEPDHDARLISSTLGVPVAGSFCAGEIGPVAGKNFLHGMTASIALLVDSGA